MENFKTFELCCQALGLNPAEVLPDVSKVPQSHQEAIVNFTKLVIITEAVNEGWKPDWNNRSEEKWIPWFDMEVDSNNPAGFLFFVSLYDVPGTYSTGGSRLCFKTEEICEFVAKNYQDLFKGIMVL